MRSADPTHYHNLDHAVISLMSCNKSNCHPAKLDVSQEEHKVTVQCTLAKEANFNEYQVDVEVPIVHNVKVSALENACVDVHDFIESNYVNVRAESGQVTMQQIKTENLTIHTKSGDVFCQGTLQVSIKLCLAKTQLAPLIKFRFQIVAPREGTLELLIVLYFREI